MLWSTAAAGAAGVAGAAGGEGSSSSSSSSSSSGRGSSSSIMLRLCMHGKDEKVWNGNTLPGRHCTVCTCNRITNEIMSRVLSLIGATVGILLSSLFTDESEVCSIIENRVSSSFKHSVLLASCWIHELELLCHSHDRTSERCHANNKRVPSN